MAAAAQRSVAVDEAFKAQVEGKPLRVQGIGLANGFTHNTLLSSGNRSSNPGPAWAVPLLLPSVLPREEEGSPSQGDRNASSSPSSQAQSSQSPITETSEVASAESLEPEKPPVQVSDVWGDLTDGATAAVSKEAGPADPSSSARTLPSQSPAHPEIPQLERSAGISPKVQPAGILSQGEPVDKTPAVKLEFVSTTDFFVTSRKFRVRKRYIVAALLTKFLRRKRAEAASSTADQDQQSPPKASLTAAHRITIGSSSGATSSNHDEARTDVRLTGKITIMDLPNEIIEVIAQHLRPTYEPVDEMNGEIRVAIWEQDDGFYPLWGKDMFGLAASCKRFRDLLYDRNRYGCIQVSDSEEALKSMLKNMPRSKRELVK